MEWVRTWLFVTIRTDQIAKQEQVARTVVELRDMIAEARTDSAVRRWTYQSRRELVGDMPTVCSNGHDISTRGTMAAPHDWLPCSCGGHWWICCRTCGEEIVEPPPACDCQPHRPRR